MVMKYSDKNLDKFFTKQEVAKFCFEKVCEVIPENNRQIFIEPSAGNGAFLEFLPKYIAFDIDPIKNNDKNIEKIDFLSLTKIVITDRCKFENTTIIGNPPFGSCCNLAIDFFNKSSEFASYIAFILPKTFRKTSIHKKLNKYFHLISDSDIPKNSFVYEGKEYDVPTCFQIWEKRQYKREIVKNTKSIIQFVSKDKAQFAIRRVGGRAGKLLDGLNYSPSSTYFCKIDDETILNKVKNIIHNTDFSYIVNQTAGVRSLSKEELLNGINDGLKHAS